MQLVTCNFLVLLFLLARLSIISVPMIKVGDLLFSMSRVVVPGLRAKARQMEKNIERLHGKYGLTPANVRKITTAVIQSSALFGSEIWWRGQKNRADDIQKMINRQARAITVSKDKIKLSRGSEVVGHDKDLFIEGKPS
jgi:hypothetical protein